MDPQAGDEDMNYLRQKQGGGWMFRMATPLALIGKPNPWDGKPFGKEIVRGLGTKRIGEAKLKRDVLLADVRKLQLHGHDKLEFSIDQAKAMRDELTRIRAKDKAEAALVRSIVTEQLAMADDSGRVDRKTLKRYAKVAFGEGLPLSEGLRMYCEARSPDSKSAFEPLSKQTFNDLNTAIKHLCAFLQVEETGAVMMDELTNAQTTRFRYDYLPTVSTHRAPNGLSHKTIKKNVTLLKAVWDWAVQVGHLPKSLGNVWASETRIRTRSDAAKATRQDFTAEQMSKLLGATERGTREGDIIRLALAGGCRVSEVALLPLSAVEKDGSGFFIAEGKTRNATRFVPLVGAAQSVLQARLAASAGSGRLFPEWPVRDSSGKSGAVSQWFTRFRRKQLGEETDGTLSLHSTRHTWRTVARRARVPESDILQLGGWADETKRTDRTYDHGLTREGLRQTQELIWKAMQDGGYLGGY